VRKKGHVVRSSTSQDRKKARPQEKDRGSRVLVIAGEGIKKEKRRVLYGEKPPNPPRGGRTNNRRIRVGDSGGDPGPMEGGGRDRGKRVSTTYLSKKKRWEGEGSSDASQGRSVGRSETLRRVRFRGKYLGWSKKGAGPLRHGGFEKGG